MIAMKMLAGKEFVNASDKAVQNVVNPATQEVIGTVPGATKEDVKRAIETAVEG